MCFSGNTIKIHFRNENAYWDNYLGYILDDKQGKALLKNDGETVMELKAEKNKENVHKLMIFKRQDDCHEMTFLGAELEENGEFLELPEASGT